MGLPPEETTDPNAIVISANGADARAGNDVRAGSSQAPAEPRQKISEMTPTPSGVSSSPTRKSMSHEVSTKDADSFHKLIPDRNDTSRKSMTTTVSNTHNDSIFAQLANNSFFQNFTLGVVVVNALWIGVDTEWNHRNKADENGKLPLQPYSDAIEHAFCGYFTFEVVVRFLAFTNKCQCWRDAWFVFDAFLVTGMVIETWIMLIVQAFLDGDGGADFLANFSVLRLLRLLRLTRMARLMRQVPELVTLCKGIVSATRAVCFILLFLVIVMYVFGIVFCSMIENAPEEGMSEDDYGESANCMFGTLGDAMMSLFTLGVLGDNMAQTWDALIAWKAHKIESYIAQWLYFVFFCISSLTLLNMLIGVLCEVITQTADEEKEEGMLNELRWCIEESFGKMDLDNNGYVCEAEWAKIKDNDEVKASLEELGVDEEFAEVRLNQMQQILFDKKFGLETTLSRNDEKPVKGLKMEDLINRVVEIRPDKDASALDVQMLQSRIKHQDRWAKKRLRAIQESVVQICRVRSVDPSTSPRDSPSLSPMTAFSAGSPTGEKWAQSRGPGAPSGEHNPPPMLHPDQSSSAGDKEKWAHQVSPNLNSKMSPKQAEPALTSVVPLAPAPPGPLQAPKQPPAPAGDPSILIRPAAIGSSPNLRDVPMEQLLGMLKSRDPSLLKGLPLSGVLSAPQLAAQRNDHWVAQQCPELHVEPSSPSAVLT